MTEPVIISLVLCGVFTGLLIGVILVHRSSQDRYLRRVERAFDLRYRQRKLLGRLAAAAELPDRSTLLLVPSVFEAAVSALDPDLEGLKEIDELRSKLLGESSCSV